MANNKIYATKAGVIEKIKVLGIEYNCSSCKGKEYSDASSGRFSFGFPFYPYKIESIVSNVDEKNRTASFIVDDKNIIWVFNGDGEFIRPSLQVGLMYVKMYDLCSFNDVWAIVSV